MFETWKFSEKTKAKWVALLNFSGNRTIKEISLIFFRHFFSTKHEWNLWIYITKLGLFHNQKVLEFILLSKTIIRRIRLLLFHNHFALRFLVKTLSESKISWQQYWLFQVSNQDYTEAVAKRSFVKKVFLEIS